MVSNKSYRNNSGNIGENLDAAFHKQNHAMSAQVTLEITNLVYDILPGSNPAIGQQIVGSHQHNGETTKGRNDLQFLDHGFAATRNIIK